MSCPFHEGGGLCAKTTCAILLHKELRVNIAVHVSKDIKKIHANKTKQKNTCAILLHKELLLAWMELRVNIAVNVPNTKPQKNTNRTQIYLQMNPNISALPS